MYLRSFSVITKSWNWEILPNNLVTFKRYGGVKDEKRYYSRGSQKNPIFRGAGKFTKKQYRGGRDCLKREVWTVCRFKGRGAWQEREGCCFGEVVNTPMDTTYHDVLSWYVTYSSLWRKTELWDNMKLI